MENPEFPALQQFMTQAEDFLNQQMMDYKVTSTSPRARCRNLLLISCIALN